MSWHKLYFNEVDMDSYKLIRLKNELERLKRKYANPDLNTKDRDIIDMNVKKTIKQIEKLEKK